MPGPMVAAQELEASEARAQAYAQALQNLRSRLAGDLGVPVEFHDVTRADADDLEGDCALV
jgi:hypothetical protein